jgi:hypothetical protein
MRPGIEKFFARYGVALSSGDLPEIVSCFDPPTVIIDEAITTLMSDHRQLSNYFTGIEERYRARGGFTASATIRDVEQLASALWLVDVSWASFDESGEPARVSVGPYKYVLRTVGAEEPLIVAAVVTG